MFANDSSSYVRTIVWANHNIPNLVDGGIYRYADDDPIPVGGDPIGPIGPIDPASFYFLLGLLFAQKVRLPLVYKQLSLNGLCDINNILLKSLDDYFLIPNEKEE